MLVKEEDRETNAMAAVLYFLASFSCLCNWRWEIHFIWSFL